jgi:glycosyltransferase involved in cell wall biosynthesis
MSMRIAVVHGIGFFYSGGGEKLVIQQVLGLRERGHEVECFAPIVDPRRSFPGWLEQVRARRLASRAFQRVRYGDALAIIATSLAAPRLARHLRRFDVVLAANQPAPWLAWWAKNRAGVPYVIYLAQPNRLLRPRAIDLEQRLIVKRDYALLRGLRPFAGWAIDAADRLSVAGASVALANGDYMAGVLSRIYRRPFESCPAGAGPLPGAADRHSGAVGVNGTVVRKPFVLLTNRHWPQKQFETAIEAMRHPQLAGQRVELVITGQPTPYTERLRRYVDSDGLLGRVRFLGLTSEAELARLYGEAACYVYPSPEEDYGMGVVEAMAAGTPVVAWDAAGPTGTVLHGRTGYLARAGDRDAFAAHVAQLVADPTLGREMGSAARVHVEQRFTLDAHLDQLEAALARAAR